jgi:hypothetical protein
MSLFENIRVRLDHRKALKLNQFYDSVKTANEIKDKEERLLRIKALIGGNRELLYFYSFIVFRETEDFLTAHGVAIPDRNQVRVRRS